MALTINTNSTLANAYKSIIQNQQPNKSLATDSLSSLSKNSESSSNSTSTDFSQIMNKALEDADLSTNDTLSQSSALLSGQTQEIHSVVIAAEKAEVALKLTLQVRNKVLEAYQEMMRMQI